MVLLFIYAAVQVQLSITNEADVTVFQVVVQPFPLPHFQARKIWDELLVAAATKVTGDSSFNKKGGVFGAPLLT